MNIQWINMIYQRINMIYPAADATAGGRSGFKLGFKFSTLMIPGLLQSCSTSQLPNPALPRCQPGQ